MPDWIHPVRHLLCEVIRGRMRLRRRQFGKHDEAGAAVFYATIFGRFEAGGGFFAVADRDQSIRRDALAHEKILGRLGSLSAEREIVFRRTDIIEVAFDFDPRSRVGFHPFGIFYQNFPGVGLQADAVELIVDIFQRGPRRCDGRDAPADCLQC